MTPVVRCPFGLARAVTILLLIAVGPVIAPNLAQADEPDKRPNLLFVIVDQMRGSAMGFLGEEPVVTPNLDRFSKEAVVCTHAASNYPICSPFRAMWMTGQYPHRNGVINNCNSQTAPYGVKLKTNTRCWSDVLKGNGYATAYLGKWHLEAPHKPFVKCSNNRRGSAWNEWTPPGRRHGFDRWYAYNTYDMHLRPLYWSNDAGRDGFHYVDQWGPTHEADLAIQYIQNKDGRQRDPDRPFALVVSMNPPHMPYHLHPKEYLAPYAKLTDEQLATRPNIPPAGTKWGDHYRKHIRDYFSMITGIDAQFGRILDALKAAGLEDNTLVVFTSDHGDCLGIHDQVTKNVAYEESMHIPLMFRLPGALKPRRDDVLFSVPDLHPTLLDLLGLGDQIPSTVEGTSRASLLRTGQGDRPTSQLYLRIPCEYPALGCRGVRTHTHTLVLERQPGKKQITRLYNNVADPYQLQNLAKDRPNLVERLIRDELLPWLRRTGDPWAKDQR
ncbi:MAG: sulfatase [Pirellulales bacterium]|nr:sulfatase [Pirellulales bacterium]